CLRVRMEFSEVPAHVLLAAPADQFELGPVGPQDDAVWPHQVQSNRGVLQEVSQLLLSPPQLGVRLLSLGQVTEIPSEDHRPVLADDIDGQLSEEFCAIGSERRDLNPLAQHRGFSRGDVMPQATLVGLAHWGRDDQLLEALAYRVLAPVAESLLRGG